MNFNCTTKKMFWQNRVNKPNEMLDGDVITPFRYSLEVQDSYGFLGMKRSTNCLCGSILRALSGRKEI